MTYNLGIPTVEELEKAAPQRNEVELLLDGVKAQVERMYDQRILVLVTLTEVLNEQQPRPVYAVYLSFVNRNRLSYRLMELTCLSSGSELPVEISAFSGPPVSFGVASTAAELQTKVEEVFGHYRARNLILSNYKM